MNQICQAATTILDPAILSPFPTVFVLGDAHGANIMIEDTVPPNSSRDLFYIDYEIAGYHSAILDLAKPFHHDVFFEMLYADKMEDFLDVQYALIDDKILKVGRRTCTDELSQAVLDIKRRYLIIPLLTFRKRISYDLDRDGPHFASALFACFGLTRNYFREWTTFIGHIAVEIVLSQA